MSVGTTERIDVDRLEVAGYDGMLGEYRKNRSPAPLSNRLPWHAKLANFHLFKLADDLQIEATRAKAPPVVVRILTGTLPDHVYQPSNDGPLDSFLNHGGEVRILVWNEGCENCGKLLIERQKEFSEQVKLRYTGTTELAEKIPHFFVVDELAYRLEMPHAPLSLPVTDLGPVVSARICFNDNARAKELKTFFESMWAELDVKNVVESQYV